jgi:hypothetical protein
VYTRCLGGMLGATVRAISGRPARCTLHSLHPAFCTLLKSPPLYARWTSFIRDATDWTCGCPALYATTTRYSCELGEQEHV